MLSWGMFSEARETNLTIISKGTATLMENSNNRDGGNRCASDRDHGTAARSPATTVGSLYTAHTYTPPGAALGRGHCSGVWGGREACQRHGTEGVAVA